MDNRIRNAWRKGPIFPWQAYHRVLPSAQLNRRYYLQGLARSLSRGMRARFCSRVHRLNIGLC